MRWSRRGLLLLALGMAAGSIPLWAQDGWIETQFHRVYLKNGNFIDGHLTKEVPGFVTLALRSGEMVIRVDTIEKIEFMKMRSLMEAPKREVLRPRTPDPVTLPRMPGPDLSRPAPWVTPTPGRATRLRSPEELYRVDPNLSSRADGILKTIESANVESRDQVAMGLKELGAGVAPYLASLLEKSDRDMSLQIFQVLYKMREPQTVPVLLELLNSLNAPLRAQAASLLSEIQGPASLKSLKPLVKDEDPAVRQVVATSVQKMGEPDSLDMLAPLIGDPDRSVRARAQAALQDLGRRIDRMPLAVSILVEALRSAEPQIKPELLNLIGKSKVSEGWKAASAYLSHDGVDVRKAAAGALAELSVPESSDAVLQQVSRENDDLVRPPLAQATSKLKISGAIPYLIEWLDSSSVEVRTAVVNSLQALAGTSFGADRRLWDEWWKKNSPK